MHSLKLLDLCLNTESLLAYNMILNRFNYDPKAKYCSENPIGPSETIPDQSYTITEIITRFTGGILPNIQRNVSYDDDPSFDSDDITKRPDFDLVDASEALSSLSEKFEAEKAAAQLEQTTQTAPEIKPDITQPLDTNPAKA